MVPLTENIRKLRKESGMTQRELADALNISDKTVSRWESGVQIPDAMILPELAMIFHTTISALYSETEETSERAPLFEPSSPLTKESFRQRKFAIVFKFIFVTGTVIAVLIGFILCHLSFLSANADEYNQRLRWIFFIILSAVCLLLVIAEILFSLSYRKKKNSILCLQTDIRYSSSVMTILYALFALILPLMTAVPFSLWYMAGVYLAGILILLVMLHMKKRLRANGVGVGKPISVISVALITVSILSVVLFCLIASSSFQGQQVSVIRQETYPISYGGETVSASVTTSSTVIENSDRFLHIVYLLFLLSSLPMTAAALLNMTELMFQSAKLKIE